MRRDSAELILRDLMTEARVRAELGGRAWRMEPSTEDSPEMRDTALHVAIIMDGTGRWAQQHNLPRTLGFRDGAKAIADVIQGALESDIEILTLCSFPVENWVRPLREVGKFASPWRHFLLTQKDEFVRRGVAVRVLGELRGFDDDTQAAVKTVVEATAQGTELRLNLMISYGGGRQEITRSARILAERVAAGELTPEEINEAAIGSTLLTAGMPSPVPSSAFPSRLDRARRCPSRYQSAQAGHRRG